MEISTLLFTLLFILVGLLASLHRQNKYFKNKIIKPYEEAIIRHDWEACDAYHAKAKAHIAKMGPRCYNPLRWFENLEN